jgi:hypothetical protein
LFIWSATPEEGSDELYDLHEDSKEFDENETPMDKRRVLETFMPLSGNPHIAEEAKELLAAKLSDEMRRIKIDGEFAYSGFRVYPEFDQFTHGVEPFAIPHDWTRYMVVDPGRQVCAVLFAAVPPPGYKDQRVFLEQELYIRNCHAELFAQHVKLATAEKRYYAFIIDSQESRKHDTGSGEQIEFQYARALKKAGVSSQASGSGFIWGSTDVKGGIEKVRSWMTIRETGQPKLAMFRGRFPNLEHEINRFRYKRDPKSGLATDVPEKRNDHLCDCLRYLAQYEPAWHKPPKTSTAKNPVLDALKAKRARAAKKEGANYVRLGPGS